MPHALKTISIYCNYENLFEKREQQKQQTNPTTPPPQKKLIKIDKIKSQIHLYIHEDIGHYFVKYSLHLKITNLAFYIYDKKSKLEKRSDNILNLISEMNKDIYIHIYIYT